MNSMALVTALFTLHEITLHKGRVSVFAAGQPLHLR